MDKIEKDQIWLTPMVQPFIPADALVLEQPFSFHGEEMVTVLLVYSSSTEDDFGMLNVKAKHFTFKKPPHPPEREDWVSIYVWESYMVPVKLLDFHLGYLPKEIFQHVDDLHHLQYAADE